MMQLPPEPLSSIGDENRDDSKNETPSKPAQLPEKRKTVVRGKSEVRPPIPIGGVHRPYFPRRRSRR